MGNESPQVKTRYRNKNSFSVDFGHQLPGKIKPGNTIKLMPIPDGKDRSISSIVINKSQTQQVENDGDYMKRQNGNKLKRLTVVNDELRRELIKISTQLTQRLKKKKFQAKKIQQQDKNANKKQSWKRQLQNAYRQIDMYKKQIMQYKQSQKGEGRTISLQNKINAIDLQIQKVQQQIQATKKVNANQYAGIKKNQVQQNVEQLKNEVQALRMQLKQMSKVQREKQKKYMQQHHYMSALQLKVKQINGQTSDTKKSRAQQDKKPSQQQLAQAEQEIESLKIKHDEYHKKINSYLTSNRLLKQQRTQLKSRLQQKNKTIQNLKYKRDALVKVIKDNLYLFAAHQKKMHQQQQLSQFQTQQEQEEDYEESPPVEQQRGVGVQNEQNEEQQDQTQEQQVQEEEQKQPEEERGTFDIAHLLNKNISKQSIEKRKALRHQQYKADPKIWTKQLTRIISKGKSMPDQKVFSSGVKEGHKAMMRITKLHIWMNKKKQITSIQPVYLIDGINMQGSKSANNIEDEYRVSFELEDEDYLKSILGIIGKEGFLDYLVLQSYFGKITKIGRQQTFGENFAVGVAKQETPIIITGASRFDGSHWRISRVQIQVLIQSAR